MLREFKEKTLNSVYFGEFSSQVDDQFDISEFEAFIWFLFLEMIKISKKKNYTTG